VLNPTSPPLSSASRNPEDGEQGALTTTRSGCCGSAPLLAFFAASCFESLPAFGFASFVPLRACCPAKRRRSVPRVSPPVPRYATRETRTVSFLLSAASSAAWRGLTGMLSPPNACVVPMSLWPPSSVPGFEQSPPIRVGDRERALLNVDPWYRSPPMIHRVHPASQPQVTCFLCPRRRSL